MKRIAERAIRSEKWLVQQSYSGSAGWTKTWNKELKDEQRGYVGEGCQSEDESGMARPNVFDDGSEDGSDRKSVV